MKTHKEEEKTRHNEREIRDGSIKSNEHQTNE